MPNAKKTLKRNNRGSRNLTRNANRNTNRKAQTFVNQRLQYNLTGSEIRNQARNMNASVQNRIDQILNTMGM